MNALEEQRFDCLLTMSMKTRHGYFIDLILFKLLILFFLENIYPKILLGLDL